MSAKTIVCRVSMIPGGDAASRKAELFNSIRESLETTELQHLNDIEISVVRSCYDPQMFTALVQFKSGLPAFLKRLKENSLYTHQFRMGDGDIIFDQSFHGLTQLYDPTADPAEITADVVAITGLDGHAYGSWSGGNPKRMWLRDFLSKDLPKCRVMIYGYNSKLSNPGLHTIADFGRGLQENLLRARRSDQERGRPIIFVAHSFGGIILTNCLIEAASTGTDPGKSDLAKSTYGFLFFGTPHRGLETVDLKCMVEQNRCQSRGDLLDNIKPGSRLLEQQLSRFIYWIGDRKIISFVEMQQTKKLQKQPDGTWGRTGEYITLVGKDSALLGLPQAVEEWVAAEGNHSTMVRFSSQTNPDYTKALDSLCRFAEEAKAVVERHFCSAPSPSRPLVHSMVLHGRLIDRHLNNGSPTGAVVPGSAHLSADRPVRTSPARAVPGNDFPGNDFLHGAAADAQPTVLTKSDVGRADHAFGAYPHSTSTYYPPARQEVMGLLPPQEASESPSPPPPAIGYDDDHCQLGNYGDGDGSTSPALQPHARSHHYQQHHQQQHQHDGAATPSSASPPALPALTTPPQPRQRVPRRGNLKRDSGLNARLRAPHSNKPPRHRHEATKTNLRPFLCDFHFAGCHWNSATKNEWKRHVSFQHIQTRIYRCDFPTCSKRKTATFNRKDLFGQHVIRMHSPAVHEPAAAARRSDTEREHFRHTTLPKIQERCEIIFRLPPQRSTCGFCCSVFEGPNSWEERMEHVGRHYEYAAVTGEDVSPARWRLDDDLVYWSLSTGHVVRDGHKGFKIMLQGRGEVLK